MLPYIKHSFYIAAACLLLLAACKKDAVSDNPPQITQIRAISPAPNDSVLTTALPGDYVVIQGANLKAAYSILFNGFPSSFNAGLFSENNLVVPIPAIAWDSIPAGKLNTLEVTTPAGTVTYTFRVTAPVPYIAAISNENAVAGRRITITGTDFYSVSKVTFPGGKEVTSITANSSSSISVVVPTGVTSGPISVTSMYGTGSSTNIRFNNHLAPAAGFLANFEDGDAYFGWQWWGGNKTSSGYSNNTGNFIQVHPSGSIGGGNGGWYADNRAVMVASAPWVPNANLSDPIDNYALKFEINVKVPWSKGSFMIAPNGNFNWLARYAPWETAANKEFTTNGDWQTVIIPLTKFLSGSGSYNPTGNVAANIAALTGGTNAASIQIMLYNDGTTVLDSFDAAVDNVRIVKIK